MLSSSGVHLFLGSPFSLTPKYVRLQLSKVGYPIKVPHSFAKWNYGSNGTNKREHPVEIEVEGKHKMENDRESNISSDDDDDISGNEGLKYEEMENKEQQFESSAYDKDPEFADILGSFLSDPSTGQSKLEERIRKKRHKILHSKTGSTAPMQVTFNSFEFSNSHIWLEFYNTPMEKDIRLVCDAIRSWHIIGRLGGCNSMNMQLSQGTFGARASYDYIQGANVSPTTFYNIGNLELQDNIARLYVDIGTTEPLLLDVLVNALMQISNDFCGIKELTFGGSVFEGWNDTSTSEDDGHEVYKI